MKVPFVDFKRQIRTIEPELTEAFLRVARSGSYILGPMTKCFEREVASLFQVKHAIGVGNGSDAITLVLRALEIGPGDEVVTVANSFVATVWTIHASGARPVLVDVGSDMNINTKLAMEACNERTKAIIPVHLTGMPVDLEELKNFCVNRGIYIIEDAAQAIGAKIAGTYVGSRGVAGAFSLHPLKNLGVLGDGGLITTNDSKLADRICLLRNHGLLDRDTCVTWGYNSRLDELQAAIALVKLKHLSTWNSRRRQIGQFYRSHLADLVICPSEQDNVEAVFHNYIIQTPLRNELSNFLTANGVETKIHYPIPFHKQACFDNSCTIFGSLKKTEELSSSILSLPIFPELTDAEVEWVVDKVKEFFNGMGVSK